MSFMRHYDLPEKVLLTLQNQLKALDPERVLPIASQLWEDDYFEARDTAASLLGQLPLEYKQQTLQMITDWISERSTERLWNLSFPRQIEPSLPKP